MGEIKLSKEQAEALCDAYEISLTDGEEETDMLKANNPELYDAMSQLLSIAQR